MTDQELAAELRALADLPGLDSRARQLRDLAEAVVEPAQGERWCDLDLFAAFDPADSVQDFPADSRFLKKLDWIQSVIIFLPIVVTWLGLKVATTAYGETLAAGGVEAARRPFLEMWQQGFDGRLSVWWRFDNIAIGTLIAIAAVVAITITERVKRRQAEDRAVDEAAALRSRLRAALTEASLILNQVRLSSPARFQAELSKGAADLNKVGKTIGKLHTQVVEALSTALGATDQATDALTAGVAQTRDSMATVEKHLTAVTAAAESLKASVDRTAYAIDAIGEKTDEAVGRVGERLGSVLAESTNGVQRSIDNLTSATEKSVRESTTGLNTRVGELVGATLAIGTAVGRVETAAAESGDRISHVLAETNGTLGAAGTEVREALDDWASTASAHASRIELVADTAGRTAQLLEDARDAMDRLPNDLTTALREIPMAVRDVTGLDVAELRDAIGRLENAVLQAATAVAAGTGGERAAG
ncbi:hypothetical protein [Herbidospora daliensis]|uniref:hypothetical protein n=1 Tax=Herbidospora daliensis TaxID=295585 RepID=UPI000782EFCC|nr:hypothetical protein [Herbidospora daliensis]